MATILLVEDAPDLGMWEARMLEHAGHRVIRCGGGPSPWEGCPMMKYGSCSIADEAEVLLFACQMYAPMRGRTYRGEHLLRTYRSHPRYGAMPTVVVAVGPPEDVGGTGPIRVLEKSVEPYRIVKAVEEVLEEAAAVKG